MHESGGVPGRTGRGMICDASGKRAFKLTGDMLLMQVITVLHFLRSSRRIHWPAVQAWVGLSWAGGIGFGGLVEHRLVAW